jgi:hypothetical protein
MNRWHWLGLGGIVLLAWIVRSMTPLQIGAAVTFVVFGVVVVACLAIYKALPRPSCDRARISRVQRMMAVVQALGVAALMVSIFAVAAIVRRAFELYRGDEGDGIDV